MQISQKPIKGQTIAQHNTTKAQQDTTKTRQNNTQQPLQNFYNHATANRTKL